MSVLRIYYHCNMNLQWLHKDVATIALGSYIIVLRLMIDQSKNTENQKAKGLPKAVVKPHTLNAYKNTLITNEPLVRNVVSIMSFNQQLCTCKTSNIALTSLYDTMKMLDIINWEPYGYIKYNPDDVDNAIINEVEDIKQITEDIEIIEVEKIEVNNNINIDYIKN